MLKVALGIGILWLALFWYLRNPAWPGGKDETGDLRVDAKAIEGDVRFLAGLEPNRSFMHPDSLAKARDHVADRLRALGYPVRLQPVDAAGRTYHNVIARYGDPAAKEVIVVGAHYDAAGKSNPGADDNASGVAGLLELARLLQERKPALSAPVELVAYTLEEPPFFRTDRMGSAVHASELRESGARVRLMVSLEMLGYYSDALFSQKFPAFPLYAFYPWRGNFMALVGLPRDRAIARRFARAMRANSKVPVKAINAPPVVPGVDFSDHLNYWAEEWPAIMLTDTAFLRNEEYHRDDAADRLDYGKIAEVIRGVYAGLGAI